MRRLLILLVLLLTTSVLDAQISSRDPHWRTVGAGALASRPANCGVNRDVYICNGAGCATNGEYHYCTAANTWTVGSGAASAYPTVTDAAPISWDLGSAIVKNGIVTLNHTTATRALNLTNLVNGGFYTLVIKQDGTGGAAMTLGTGCTWKVASGGAGAITLTATASAIDILTFTYDGSNCYANLQTNFN